MTCPLGLLFLLVAALTPSAHAAPVCVLGMLPCFVRCNLPSHRPADPYAARQLLTQQPGHELTHFDRWSALFTTPFKCLGVNGWRRYHFKVVALGVVKNAATSWDGLRTVDLQISQFSGDRPDDLNPSPRFIRVEIVRSVWKHLPLPISPGDSVRVEGELHWDGHGFLEIHPQRHTEVQFQPQTKVEGDSSGFTLNGPL